MDLAGQIAEHAFKILLLLVILFIAFLVHELGHLIAARILGLPVQTVQIGRGKILFNRTDRKDTRWQIHAIPFGAHVQIMQLPFFARSYAQRAFVILCGPLINLLLPFLLIGGFYLSIGQPSIPPVIVGVEKNLIADQAGLKAGDRVLEVNGIPVLNYKDIWQQAYETGASEKHFKIERGGETKDITLIPLWSEYRDEDGIDRANARFGILWLHTALKPSAILEFNGKDVKDQPEKLVSFLKRNLDQRVTMQIKGPDEGPYIYELRPRRAANLELGTAGKPEDEKIYLGPTADNFYLHQPVAAQLEDAVTYVSERIGKIALLPFQIFPLDPYTVADEHAVGAPETKTLNQVYGFIHKLCIASIFIGLLNLLPLPFLDGGHLMIQGIESARAKPLSSKAKARLFTLMFIALYGAVLLSNMDNLPRYIDSKVKKLQESKDHTN